MNSKIKRIFYSLLLPLSILVMLFLLSRRNYLLYHSIIEFFAIFTGFAIALIAFSTRKLLRDENTIFLKLGIIYFYVPIIDFLHTISYKGMGVFSQWTANQPTQFWIAGRTLEVLGFVMIFFFPKLKEKYLSLILGLLTSFSIFSIFSGFFPPCFFEGKGLTAFKVFMEYLLVIALALTILKVFEHKTLSRSVKKTLLLSIVLTIAGELSFTLYSDVFGFFNFLGHVFRFLSYFVIFRGVVVECLTNPMNTLMSELEKSRKKLEDLAYYDKLTELYNRNFFEEFVKKQLMLLERENIASEIIVIDIDDFKHINDSYGHHIGDEVLKLVAESIKESIRSSDIAVRYGGDEFLIILTGSDDGARDVVKRIETKLKEKNRFDFPISISYGTSKFLTASEYKSAFVQADSKMYKMKDERKMTIK